MEVDEVARPKFDDYRVLIGCGQILMILGFLSSLLMIGGYLEGDASAFISSDLSQLAAFVAIPLFGVSIFMNVRGLRLYRERRASNPR